MANNESNPSDDPFGPPTVSTVVQCLHCGEQYESCRIEWRVETGPDGKQHGFWCCPIPGCNGIGFGFDILPIDPNYRDDGGWFGDDDDFERDQDLVDTFEFGDALHFEPIEREQISPTMGPRNDDTDEIAS